MLNHVIYLYGFNLNFAKTLVGDVSPEQMSQQPNGVVNHPAWTLGHLASSAAQLLKVLGKEATLPASWGEAFKTGGIPSDDPSVYPSKDELLATLGSLHDQVGAAVQGQPTPQRSSSPTRTRTPVSTSRRWGTWWSF